MQRTILALALTAMLVLAGLAIGSPAQNNDDATTVAAQSDTAVLGRVVTTSKSRPSSTTTSEPRVRITTTTVADTTTTVGATTTTDKSRGGTTTTVAPPTTEPPVVVVGSIPKTVPYNSGLKANGGHKAIITCGATTPDFDCDQFGSNKWWEAPYFGTNLPYTPGYAWVDGDRQGYKCAYGFLQDVSSGELIGRWAAVLTPDAEAYGKVNDAYMDEGVRYYDGELANEGGAELQDPNKASECTDILSKNIDYTIPNNGPDERPRIGFFNSQGQVVDIRDYSNTALGSPGKFKLMSFNGKEAIVGFYPAQNDLPAVSFYYTAFGSGQIAVDFNGTGPYAP